MSLMLYGAGGLNTITSPAEAEIVQAAILGGGVVTVTGGTTSSSNVITATAPALLTGVVMGGILVGGTGASAFPVGDYITILDSGTLAVSMHTNATATLSNVTFEFANPLSGMPFGDVVCCPINGKPSPIPKNCTMADVTPLLATTAGFGASSGVVWSPLIVDPASGNWFATGDKKPFVCTMAPVTPETMYGIAYTDPGKTTLYALDLFVDPETGAPFQISIDDVGQGFDYVPTLSLN